MEDRILDGKRPENCQLLPPKKARGAMARFIVQEPAYDADAIQGFLISDGYA